jgi:beta-galactosidase/beta-glucuronidase
MRFALILAAVLAAAQEVPRPEAPDPQFERPLWQTLNGRWEFEFDDADADLAENWAAAPRKFSRSILVPFCFESRKSGIGDTSFHPVVWYRRTAVMPDAWKGKRGLLKSGAVDYHAAVWVNGGFAGERFGGHTPFGFDITAHLKAGPNSLVVRAYDSPTDRSQPRSEQYWEPKSRSIFYTRTTGIWQSGWLEAAGAPYLERFRLTPEMDGSLPAEVRITRFTDGLALETEVSLEGKVVARSWTAAAARVFRAGVQVPSPQPWTLNNPRLYDVTFTLKKGEETLDRVRSYTGFRKAAVENGRFTFNGARKHQKVEDPRFLYRAD